MRFSLFDDYYLELATDLSEFANFYSSHHTQIFSNTIGMNTDSVLSEQEITNRHALSKNMGSPYRLRMYICYGDEKIGWVRGHQTDAETFYMANTAIFPPHQNKGIYKSLLPKVLDLLREKGFQKVCSKHHASNNQVLVPKLRQGFLITGFEINEVCGAIVHLSYFFNAQRKNIWEYRVGSLPADDVISHALGLIPPHQNLPQT